MKTTKVKYCGECRRDFLHLELVFYASIENTCFCNRCKSKLDIKDWELRKFKKEDEENETYFFSK